MRNLLIVFVLVIIGCSRQIASSNSFDGSFLLQSRVTEGLVFFEILDNQSGQVYTIDTRASDYQKWAAGWLSNQNVVLLYSSDIGSYAWHYEGAWVPIALTNEMEKYAENLYKKKYK